MKHLLLVEDQEVYARPFGEALREYAPKVGWQHCGTIDNVEDAVKHIVAHRDVVRGVIVDMRIHGWHDDFRPIDLKSEHVGGIQLINRVQQQAITEVRFVIITAFLAPGDPVKRAVDTACSAHPSIVGVMSKSIDPEKDMLQALYYLNHGSKS